MNLREEIEKEIKKQDDIKNSKEFKVIDGFDKICAGEEIEDEVKELILDELQSIIDKNTLHGSILENKINWQLRLRMKKLPIEYKVAFDKIIKIKKNENNFEKEFAKIAIVIFLFLLVIIAASEENRLERQTIELTIENYEEYLMIDAYYNCDNYYYNYNNNYPISDGCDVYLKIDEYDEFSYHYVSATVNVKGSYKKYNYNKGVFSSPEVENFNYDGFNLNLERYRDVTLGFSDYVDVNSIDLNVEVTSIRGTVTPN